MPELLTHRDCDAFWDPARETGLGPDVRTAAVHVDGWYDLFVQGALDGYTMYRQSTDPFVAGHQYLIVGPWRHDGLGEPQVGELKQPGTATLDLFATGLVLA